MFKLLIVEDENLIRENLISMINFKKHNLVLIAEASNGADAIDLIKELNPHIVLLDIKIPIYDGIEVLRMTSDQNYKCIIISGFAHFEYAQNALKYQVSDYLLKPINQHEINNALEKIIKQIFEDNDENVTLEGIYSEHTNLALKYIVENISSDLSLDVIASKLNISKDYLNRLFKMDTGRSIYQTILYYRIRKACILLIKGNQKIYEIGALVGFRDYKTFYRAFYNEKKKSPKEYRDEFINKQLRND